MTYKVGKHVTCDATFVTVRAQPYWKLYPYVVFFFFLGGGGGGGAYFSIRLKF